MNMKKFVVEQLSPSRKTKTSAPLMEHQMFHKKPLTLNETSSVCSVVSISPVRGVGSSVIWVQGVEHRSLPMRVEHIPADFPPSVLGDCTIQFTVGTTPDTTAVPQRVRSVHVHVSEKRTHANIFAIFNFSLFIGRYCCLDFFGPQTYCKNIN